MFKRGSTFFCVLVTVILSMMFVENDVVMASTDFLPPELVEMSFLSSNTMMDHTSRIYILMISIVVCAVAGFAEFYMSGSSTKGFFLIKSVFAISMYLLVVSSGILFLALGWDLLGLSSICLVVFYPNMNSMVNSFLTFFFNRFSDVCMIVFLVWVLSLNFGSSYPFLKESLVCVLLLCSCSFMKSALFPLSSWLPAAMSAPTPISAMVHSSTLVTAGCLVMTKIIYYISCNFGLLSLISIVSILTSITGGVLACMEKDFKKMIAFSTMSQISMIIYFLSSQLIFFSLAHTIYHAFFKTFLFCCAGSLFGTVFGSQFKNFVSPKPSLSIFMFYSIYSMSGFYFSLSFFTKDKVLESLISDSSTLNSSLFLLIFSSVTTIYYSSSLLKCTLSNFSIFKVFESSDWKKSPLLLLLFFNIFFDLFFSCFLNIEDYFCSSFADVIFISFVLMLPVLLYNFFSLNSFSSTFAVTVGGMRNFSFKKISKLLSVSSVIKATMDDFLFFKSNYLSLSKVSQKSFSTFFDITRAIILFFLLILVEARF